MIRSSFCVVLCGEVVNVRLRNISNSTEPREKRYNGALRALRTHIFVLTLVSAFYNYVSTVNEATVGTGTVLYGIMIVVLRCLSVVAGCWRAEIKKYTTIYKVELPDTTAANET
jgi:hypothetical protein